MSTLAEYGSPELPKIVAQTKSRMEDGYYHPTLLNAAVQHNRDHFNLLEAHMFMDFWVAIGTGKLVIATFNIGLKPSGDAPVDFEKLAEHLSNFEYLAVTGTPEAPSLTWNIPLQLGQYDVEGGPHIEIVPPFYAPLSIGYSEHENTRNGIRDNLVFARWPFDVDELVLIHHPSDIMSSDLGDLGRNGA